MLHTVVAVGRRLALRRYGDESVVPVGVAGHPDAKGRQQHDDDEIGDVIARHGPCAPSKVGANSRHNTATDSGTGASAAYTTRCHNATSATKYCTRGRSKRWPTACNASPSVKDSPTTTAKRCTARDSAPRYRSDKASRGRPASSRLNAAAPTSGGRELGLRSKSCTRELRATAATRGADWRELTMRYSHTAATANPLAPATQTTRLAD